MVNLAEKFMNMMKLSDDESGGYEEEYSDIEEEYEDSYEEDSSLTDEPEAKPRKPILSFRRKKQDDGSVETKEKGSEGNVIPFNGRQEEGEVVKVIKPQVFNEAQVVAEYLKEGKTIVVNLEGIEISQAQRIIDFVGGASFAVDGTLKAISNNIFIVAPGNIEVSGDLRDEIASDSMIAPELSKF